MIALITALLRMLDIILHGYHRQIILLTDHLRKLVNIGRKRTNNADSCDIVDIVHHIVNGTLVSISFQLLDNTLR